MSVRQSLLAILAQGPCYGYQLRAEFDRRTGSTWPLNVGQIYNTLDRLERDGLVAKGEPDAQGHVFWTITDAGGREARDWLGSPVDRGAGTRDELAIKIALAATLPGVDAAEVIRAQREASLARLRRLSEATAAGGRADADDPEELARRIIDDALVAAAEAEVRWLDRTAERLARGPRRSAALALSTERPRRGRPARTDAAAARAR